MRTGSSFFNCTHELCCLEKDVLGRDTVMENMLFLLGKNHISINLKHGPTSGSQRNMSSEIVHSMFEDKILRIQQIDC